MSELGFEVEVEIQLRWRDLDALGHVNNAVFVTYLEVARVAYFQAMYGKVETLDFNFILARIEVDFLSPVVMDDLPICRIGIHEAGHKSFTFRYLLESRKDGRALARGTSVQVCYDYAKGRTIPLPEKMWSEIVELRASKGLDAPLRRE
jgi:acyl-CoA thioester hydrolase